MRLNTLTKDLTVSLKIGDRDRVDTLRFLLAEIHNRAIAKYGNKEDSALTDEDIESVIRKQVKTHQESITAFEKGKRSDLVQKENVQLAILKEYLPEEMSDESLKNLLSPIVSSGETNFGLLMKQAMVKVEGKADGGRVAEVLRKILQGT